MAEEKKTSRNKIEIPKIELPGPLISTEIVTPETIKIAKKTPETSPAPDTSFHVDDGSNVTPSSLASAKPTGPINNRKLR